MTARFGECLVDTETCELRRDGRAVHLTPKAFDLLLLLLWARPGVVSKDRIRHRLWPDTHVAASSLPGLVREIRRAVGDDARRPRFVRTVHRRGYAFSGDAATGGQSIAPRET